MKITDKFFSQKYCDRCGKSLNSGRTMSMLNENCICMECSKEERKWEQFRILSAEQSLAHRITFIMADCEYCDFNTGLVILDFNEENISKVQKKIEARQNIDSILDLIERLSSDENADKYDKIIYAQIIKELKEL